MDKARRFFPVRLQIHSLKGFGIMCCRYYIERDDPVLAQIGDAALNSSLMMRFYEKEAKALCTGGEVRPDSIVPVVASSRSGNKAYFPMLWGYRLGKRPLLVNARSETASAKPLFEASWRSHRCVIPSSWYYEWEHFVRPNGRRETGEKYLIQPSGERITWLCGLYRIEAGLPHFVVLTCAPSEGVAFIHDRMPLMIHEKDVDAWINPSCSPDEVVYRAVTSLHYEKAGT